jgi:hypothetical protein
MTPKSLTHASNSYRSRVLSHITMTDKFVSYTYQNNKRGGGVPTPSRARLISAGIFEQFMGARNRVGIGLSYRPPRLPFLRNWFLGINSWAHKKFKKSGSGLTVCCRISNGPVLIANAAKLGIGQERGTRDKPSQ